MTTDTSIGARKFHSPPGGNSDSPLLPVLASERRVVGRHDSHPASSNAEHRQRNRVCAGSIASVVRVQVVAAVIRGKDPGDVIRVTQDLGEVDHAVKVTIWRAASLRPPWAKPEANRAFRYYGAAGPRFSQSSTPGEVPGGSSKRRRNLIAEGPPGDRSDVVARGGELPLASRLSFRESHRRRPPRGDTLLEPAPELGIRPAEVLDRSRNDVLARHLRETARDVVHESLLRVPGLQAVEVAGLLEGVDFTRRRDSPCSLDAVHDGRMRRNSGRAAPGGRPFPSFATGHRVYGEGFP